MRSRYTAYATGRLDYIEKTCAGPARLAFNRIEAEMSSRGTEWLGLEITGREAGLEDDDTGMVRFTFKVRQQGHIASQSETSMFRKIEGLWFYWDREDSGKARTTAIGRNDPCPCGSGKKYKKCCGTAAG